MAFQMNMTWALIGLPAGLVILLKGADLLVDGAVALAERLGVRPLVIGLTVVAMGTSAPEVAASVTATLRGFGDIAVGNVYGSNIANLALVGGLCALIRPLGVQRSMQLREIPVMVLVALALYPVLANAFLGRVEAVILLLVFVGLISVTILSARGESKAAPLIDVRVEEHLQHAAAHRKKSVPMVIALVGLGLLGLAAGAHLTVESAVFLGKRIGLSDAVIGLTIIAVGTSLPELMTSAVAAFKGHDDLSIGNLVGSNVFNTLLVIGVAGAVRPFSISGRLVTTDYWIMVGVSVLFMLLVLFHKRISRTGGALLLTVYITYMAYLFIYTKSA
ncbi:MAG: calcium/sodium antiporter [Phycisphaerae bacterium]|nr:calcium/sodium antiporter [Phycisphaerae bacterium]